MADLAQTTFPNLANKTLPVTQQGQIPFSTFSQRGGNVANSINTGTPFPHGNETSTFGSVLPNIPSPTTSGVANHTKQSILASTNTATPVSTYGGSNTSGSTASPYYNTQTGKLTSAGISAGMPDVNATPQNNAGVTGAYTNPFNQAQQQMGLQNDQRIGNQPVFKSAINQNTTGPEDQAQAQSDALQVKNGATPNYQNGIPPSVSPTYIPANPPALNSTNVSNTPSASNLSGTNPLNVPSSSNTSTAQNGLRATSDASMTTPKGYSVDQSGNLTINQDPNAVDTTGRNGILNRVLGDTSTLGQKGQATNDLNTAMGVDTKAQNYIDAFNAYNSKKVTYQQQEEAYKNANQGGLQSGADKQFAVMQRQNNADLANLAVITQAAQGNYTTAMDIVKRKIDAEFDPVQTEVDNLSKFLATNNQDLTASQTQQLELQKFQLQNNLDQLKSTKLSGSQMLINNGAYTQDVASKLDSATTSSQVNEIIQQALGGGSSGGSGSSSYGQVSNPQYQSYVKNTLGGQGYVSTDYLSPLTDYQKQEAGRQYSAAGITVLPAEDANIVDNIQKTKQNLSDLGSILIGTPDSQGNLQGGVLGSGPIGRIGSGISNFIAGKTQSNPQIAAIDNYSTLAINALQALGAGKSAKINQVEINNQLKNIPTIYDSKETAQAKMKVLNNFLDNSEKQIFPNRTGVSSSTGGSSKSTSGFGWTGN